GTLGTLPPQDVSGVVKDAGLAVAAAHVTALGAAGETAAETDSDPLGHFVLSLHQGAYTIVVVGPDGRPGHVDGVEVADAPVDAGDVTLVSPAELGQVRVQVDGGGPFDGTWGSVTVAA